MRIARFILGPNHEAIKIEDIFAWSDWFNDHTDVVKSEVIGRYSIRTVFLWKDLNIYRSVNPRLAPWLFETMAVELPEELILEIKRCSTWDEAVEQHERIAAKLGANAE
jgi:hypothetical protein